jgi:Fe(3+) dicitrate transport protein
MKTIFFIIILSIICDFSSLAQDSFGNTTIIRGTVMSKNTVVPYVEVFFAGTTTGTITNEHGKFSLVNESELQRDIIVRGLGYKTKQIHINTFDAFHDIIIELESDELLLEEVVVTGSRIGLLRFLPGCAHIIHHKEIETTQAISGNDIFRNIPGIHVLEEEGAGLRVNIGIRGLDPDKSRNVLILEDGIPVALAPYGEPEMYYTPNIERMDGIEILKGNGSILFGPQTIGGVVNYLTADPPQNAESLISFKTGSFGYNNSYIDFGNTIHNIGFKIGVNRKQAENFGATAFLLHDIYSKFLFKLSALSQLSVKIGVYNEISNATYVGLTQPMYDSKLFDNLRIAPNDELKIKRYSISSTFKHQLTDGLQFNTTLFAYTTTRNWNRQDFTYNPNASNLTEIMHGFDTFTEGAIYMRNSTGQRNRQFEVAGIEPRMQYRYQIGQTTNKIDAGIRYLYEKAYEQRVNGSKAGVYSGNIAEDEIRAGQAVSSFIQNKVTYKSLSFTTGLRNENVWYSREIYRLASKDTLISANSDVFALIPGAGINYNITENTGLFTGVHKGFAPPRTKDAISNEGKNVELDAEHSWNYEIGIRSKLKNIHFETTLFYMDFSNQVIPVSESSGGAGAGYINGGATTHKGIESSILILFGKLIGPKWNASLALHSTFSNSTFSGNRYILYKTSVSNDKSSVYQNVKGNKTPYAPSVLLSSAITIESPFGLTAKLSGNYVGKQYTDALNTENVYEWIDIQNDDTEYKYIQATANGRIGALKQYYVLHFSILYKHEKSGFGANLGVKNITNERYIVTRRPQGIRLGLPRFISCGITYQL